MLRIVAEVNTEADKEQAGATFDDFWLLYPRRVARKDALKIWARMSEADRMAAVVALVDWRRIWVRRDVEYVPYPATWLNGERWTDELPVAAVASVAAHVPAKLPEKGERSVMPQSVRDAIARLRK